MQILRLLLVALTLCLATAAASSPIWYSQCESHGFRAGGVPCGTCKLLSRALGAGHASSEACASCCSPGLDLGGAGGSQHRRQFDSVSLRVCRMQVGSAGAQEWLEKREKAWAERGVVVEDACEALGQGPVLVLRNDSDEGLLAEGAGEEAEGGGRKRAGSSSSSSSSSSAKRRRGRGQEAPAPIVGIPVPIAAWKVEHIDAFIEAALKKE